MGIAKNPLLGFQNMLKQNPNYNKAMEFIRQNGNNAEQAYYNLAREKGVDPEQFLQQIKNTMNFR